MKYINKIISFSIVLIILLLSFSIYNILNNSIKSYKEKIINDYSIVAIAYMPIDFDNLKTKLNIKYVELISKDRILDKYKDKLSKKELRVLSVKLPYFYNIKLNDFPDSKDLENIKNILLVQKGVKNVETFSKNHTKLYTTLKLLQNIVGIFFIFIFIFSVLVFYKQVVIWRFEERESIEIMKLHGASLLFMFKPIVMVAVISSLISIIFGALFMLFVDNIINYILPIELLDLINYDIDKFSIILFMFLLAFLTSFLTVFITIFLLGKK